MASKQEFLQGKYNSLKAKYNELESFYYKNFKMVPKNSDTRLITTRDYYLESTHCAKEQFEVLHRQFKAALAEALEALESYKSGWFSDKEYAADAQWRIGLFTKDSESILYHLEHFELRLK